MSNSPAKPNTGPPGVPLVVQLSFAGSRALFDAARSPRVDGAAFERGVQRLLRERIEKLRTDLQLTERHFWCGISPIAIGGDTVFTRVCQELEIPQRIYLPQHRDEFLAARGKNGQADFSDEEQRVAQELLDSPHIIQERVVSTANDRQARFEEVNRELARLADVIICLVRADAEAKPGGSLDLAEQGRKRHRPVLEIRVSVGADGQPAFAETWHHAEWFKLPALPHELNELGTDLRGIPTLEPYCTALKDFASGQARGKQAFFRYSAITIVGTHFLATLCAVLALWIENDAVTWLLVVELALLGIGQWTHRALHRSHAPVVWGMSRVAAELARSVLPLASVATYLSHLFTLPMPESVRPLLRTLNVLHLRESHRLSPDTLAQRRDEYIRQRMLDEKSGQIPYYRRNLKSATRWLKVANGLFVAGSVSAFLATLFKLIVHRSSKSGVVWTTLNAAWSRLGSGALNDDLLSHVLGSFAILLPVVAVAALSLAASLDLQARVSTYREILDFLEEHHELLKQATSEREFGELAIEAETRLLGETATWYFRRSYTSVT
jgi:hypothetical protein